MLHRVKIDIGTGVKSYELDDLKFDQLVALILDRRPRNDGAAPRNEHGFISGTHYTHGVPDDGDF